MAIFKLAPGTYISMKWKDICSVWAFMSVAEFPTPHVFSCYKHLHSLGLDSARLLSYGHE